MSKKQQAAYNAVSANPLYSQNKISGCLESLIINSGDNMAVSVDNENFDKEVLKTNGIVLADFYSETCGPCRRVSPVLAELEEDYGDKIKLAKINVNLDAKLARKYVVGAVPTIVFFKDGEESGRIVGAANKSQYSSVIDKMM